MKFKHRPTRRIARLVDAENGLAVEVYEVTGGYSVTLRDTDADLGLDGSRLYPNKADALDYAEGLIAGVAR